MAKLILGNHAAVVVPRHHQDSIRQFYCDVLGFTPTRLGSDKDDFQLGDDEYFHLAVLYGEVADEAERLRSGRSIFLELKADDVEKMRQKIIASGVVVIDMPDPHLYFQAPGGQVFRLVGMDEDLSQYERDVSGDEGRNTSLVTAARRGAERPDA